MNRTFSTILMIILALLLLAGLSAARYISIDRPPESEAQPNRSTYNSGPTGTRAFYQLLEASRRPVGRWRDNFQKLEEDGTRSSLVMIGPFNPTTFRNEEEIHALERWINNGGQLLLITRQLQFELRGPYLQIKQPDQPASPPSAQSIIDGASDRFILQPTRLTRGLQGLAFSTLATRLQIDDQRPVIPSPANSDSVGPVEDLIGPLTSPIVHLGDRDGAILTDFNFGGGRVIILTDPFIVSNRGVTQGTNLELALNLIRELDDEVSSQSRLILFDEYHHGFRNDSNQLVALLRGTSGPAIVLLLSLAGQICLICFLLWYARSRRFTRPIPLPEVDRHAPLEFVDSMANLQQTAEARDLAIENIYPRFRNRLCKRLGLSSRAKNNEIMARIQLIKIPISAELLRQTMIEAELILLGETVNDRQLLAIIDRLYAVDTALKGAPTRNTSPAR